MVALEVRSGVVLLLAGSQLDSAVDGNSCSLNKVVSVLIITR